MRQRNNRKILRIIVYLVLFISASANFIFNERLWHSVSVGDFPFWAPLIAPLAFTLFIIFYIIDRWILIRQSPIYIKRSIFQIIFACIFLTLLLPKQAQEYREHIKSIQSINQAYRLLKHKDHGFRKIACEVLGYRKEKDAVQYIDELLQKETNLSVQKKCEWAKKEIQKL